MSTLLRLPLVLLIALAMTLVWSAPASADPATTSTAGECPPDQAPEACTPLEELPAPEGSTDDGADAGAGEGTDPGAAAGDGTETETPPGQGARPGAAGLNPYSYGEWAGSAMSGRTGESAPLSEGEDTEGDAEEEEEEEEEPAGEPDPAAVGACLAAVVEDLLGDLETLGAGGEEPAAAIAAALPQLDPTDPTSISGFLTDLGVTPGNLAAGEALVTKALEDAAECLTATAPPGEETPTGGGQKPPSSNPPTTVQSTYYANCDDARAQGKAPVYMTDPGYRAGLDSDSDGIGCEEDIATGAAPVNQQSAGRLAYTGFDLELWLRAGAILLSSGTLFLLAGRRQA